ncbi:RluA family pseudouridine synthase [Candidatus Gottesmanbacteria bacterium]|nr:RluA family pseudouridine synthase [Candidatus Gottesmanbacteria bacterium]
MNIPILFEDEFLLVVDKPSGIVVNRAESVKEETVQEWMDSKIKNQKSKIKDKENSEFYKRSGVVHRLDRETSGVLLLAKTEDVFADLQKQFKERTILKTYIALVHGLLIGAGEINVPIARLPWNREQFGVVPGGRQALTKYKLVKLYARGREKYTLVGVNPETGRTHQIRVHFKYIGHPIVSDFLYGGRKMYRQDKIFCPRLFLHASSISFVHPKTQKRLTVSSPLPSSLESILSLLEVL